MDSSAFRSSLSHSSTGSFSIKALMPRRMFKAFKWQFINCVEIAVDDASYFEDEFIENETDLYVSFFFSRGYGTLS